MKETSAGTVKILVLEVDKEFADLLARILKVIERGSELTVVDNVRECVETFRKLVPDLVIIDISGEGEEEFKVVEEITKINPGEKILVLTRQARSNLKRLLGTKVVEYFIPLSDDRESVAYSIAFFCERILESKKMLRKYSALKSKMDRLKQLLPLCAGCKKVALDLDTPEERWIPIEKYLIRYSQDKVLAWILSGLSEKVPVRV